MYDHVDPNLSPKQIRQLPPRERLPYIKHIRVMHPRAQEILRKIRDCYEDREISADPECLLLVGPTGTGKTTLLEIFTQEHPQVSTDTGQIVPVLMSTIRVPATEGNFASGLLEDLGDPRHDKGLIGNRMSRFRKFVKDCEIAMLILDEIQHFIDQKSQRVLVEVTNSLKNLLKKYNLACVLTGTQGEAEQIIKANGQLDRLFPDAVVLSPFVWDKDQPETIKEFKTLLHTLERTLPLNGESNLINMKRAWRIFVATEGRMGYLMALIRKATSEALKQGVEFLDDDLLAYAFKEKLAGERRGISNPFVGPAPKFKP